MYLYKRYISYFSVKNLLLITTFYYKNYISLCFLLLFLLLLIIIIKSAGLSTSLVHMVYKICHMQRNVSQEH